MKICVFSDVHGNIDALNMLISTADFQTADIRICLGDAVVMGPYPNECCKALLDNNCIWLLGNHDSYIANGLPEEEYQNFKQDKIDHQNYMRNIIKPEYKKIMENLPYQHIMTIGDKRLFFTHYMWETMDNVADNPDVPTEDNISKLFNSIYADYIIFGHEHNASHFITNYKEFICVGSLGMKYPGHYSVIDADENNINITHKTINFDVEKVKKDILNAGYPRAEKYVKFFN